MPPHDIHAGYLAWAEARLGGTPARLFRRMAGRAGIAHRFSVLPIDAMADSGFYAGAPLPPTSARMALYAEAAPALAERAVRGLGETGAITHLVVASCTGFVAPGVDQLLAARLGLAPTVERTLIGFMGCYAGVVALRTARHIVRSEPTARVLVVCVELCTIHLQDDRTVEPLLAQMLFGDGAAAALVTADPHGLALGTPFSLALPRSERLITWDVGDQGFIMGLSGEVPGRIGTALGDPATAALLAGDLLAVHAGGRSILDAVDDALALPPDRLAQARAVLEGHGNMSSATLLFTLARMMDGPSAAGAAVAFGPGVAAEGLRIARP